MRRRTIILALLVFLLLLVGSALVVTAQTDGQLTEREVRTAVETWVRHVTADARPDARVERMEAYQVDGRTVGYIAHLQGGGFCLAGASELLLPVYVYNPSDTYDPTHPGHQLVLWEMAARLSYLEEAQAREDPELEAYAAALAERAAQWQDLKAGRVPTRAPAAAPEAAPSLIELPLTSTWHQGSPYNDQCPNLTPGQDERVVTGCNATAVAQIMNYWRWPNTGVGSDSVIYEWRFRTTWDEEPLAGDPDIPPGWTTAGRLEWTPNNGGRLRMNGYWDMSVYQSAQRITDTVPYQTALTNLYNRLTPQTTTVSANFGAATYSWSQLQDVHADPVDDGDPEVAELNVHVGVAVDTYYGLYGSGSDLWRVPTPLAQYFRYDPDVTYGNPLVPATMVTEIQWLRPVAMAGSGPPGGHAWVVYGYNTGTSPWQFMMNMGWGGASEWHALDDVPQGLNDNHNFLYQIAPLGVVGFVGGTAPGDGSPAQPYQNIQEALNEAPDGATLIFKAGSDNTFSSPTLTINRPLTLKGANVTIRPQ